MVGLPNALCRSDFFQLASCKYQTNKHYIGKAIRGIYSDSFSI